MKFDNDGKIATIQQSWDQGALLKQLEVIGKTGRNWPIRDSVDQITLITKSGGKPADAGPAPAASKPVPRAHSKSITRDPHATLRETGLNPRDEEPDRVVSPFSGTRPRQRTFEEILGDEANDGPDQSPSKAVAPKIGAGKNLPANRLFEKDNDVPSEPESPDDGKAPTRFMKPHPTKYEHFSFADGSDPADAPEAGVEFSDIKSKHRSQWDFQDFVTPQKAKPSKTIRQPRHWGTDQNDYDESPAKPAPGMAGGKSRRGANTQIELQDDGEDNERNQRAGAGHRGAMHNSGHGLYKNRNAADEESEAQDADSRALGNITNLKNRHKDFEPHFGMTDDSPISENHKVSAPVPEDRKKAVNMMQANWSTYDQSPSAQKENSKPASDQAKGNPEAIKTHGDGMGNPKARDWTKTKAHGGIKLGGDGMGNPKGGRGWSIGDDSEEEEQQSRPVPGKSGAAQKAANNFWDF